VERALTQRRMATENLILKEELAQRRGAPQIVGEDPQLKQVSLALHRAAATDTTVLLEGESGTGKELFARALHALSPRADGPFVAINCAAIPETLLETELFGHEKGAFTGADKTNRGYFQASDGGTLLLDEIGELPLAMQSKLLRVLEDSAVTPVGTTAPQKIDVRIVAATNRDLEEEVTASEFRQDLFFRLNIVNIKLPPLRERPEDLPLLTRFFLDEICRTNNFETREIDHSLLDAFAKYDWPGNVRELKNTLESLVVLSGRTTLTADDLPEKFFREHGAPSNGDSLDEEKESNLNLNNLSKQTILKALESCRGNRTEAAKQLGISRRTLHRRLNEFGLRE